MFRFWLRAASLLTILMTLFTLAAYIAGHTTDSDVLAFTSTQGDTSTLIVMDTTRGFQYSIGEIYIYSYPVWSVDGRLAYYSDRDGNREIYVWDGAAALNIFNNPADDDYPAWSADGRLAFTSTRDGNDEIYVWDGKSAVNLTHSPANESFPAWRP